MKQIGYGILITIFILFMTSVSSLSIKDYIIIVVLLLIGISIYALDD